MKSAMKKLFGSILKYKPRRTSIVLLIALIFYCVLMFLIADSIISNLDVTDHKVTRRIIEDTLKRLMEMDKGTGCLMPKLDAFAPEIMAFEREVPPLNCGKKNWVVCKKDRCHFDSEMKHSYSDVYCSYQDIIYLADEDATMGAPTILSQHEVYQLNASDFIKVSCGGTNLNGTWSNWTGIVAGVRPFRQNHVSNGTDQVKRYNILVFAFDSTSSNGFERKMPLSYAMLTQELEAVLLHRFNIVGDGTAQTVVPMMTGYYEYELPEIRKSVFFRELHYVDSLPLIWYLLKNHGYKTGYLEDSPDIGTFTNRYTGFVKQPTNLYGHPLVLVSSWYHETKNCISGIPIHKVFMDLTEQFMDDDSSHRFIFTFSGIAHDNHNMLRAADEDFALWLKRMKKRGLLEDTVLFVMGDHGPRHGGNRNTMQGRLEERLPFMAIVLPESLKRAHPEIPINLAHNAHVLTTPFDLHATFLDIAGLRHHIVNISVPGADFRRSLSLFEEIPIYRSCTEAGVQQAWCACLHWRPLPNESPISYRLADELVSFINILTQTERQNCVVWELDSIEWVKEITPRKDLMITIMNEGPNYFKRKITQPLYLDYQIKVILKPGLGIFEATLTHEWNTNTISTNEYSISRISTYGGESKCIKGRRPDLAKYCYCYRRSIWDI